MTDRIVHYAAVLKATHGGVTLSGGEPLLQHTFAGRIFRTANRSACTPHWTPRGSWVARVDDAFLDDVNLVLLDC